MRSAATRARRAFAIADAIAATVSAAALAAIAMPLTQDAQDAAKLTQSLTNLRHFGIAHATYASEWNDRQWTTCPDDLAVIINDAHGGVFPKADDGSNRVRPVPLGFTIDGNHTTTAQAWAIQPFWCNINCSIGSFRAFHTKPFSQYVNGKVYDPIFWAPKDDSITPEIKRWFDDPGEWPRDAQSFYFSTYCTAVSAMLSPDVFRAESQGGFQDPLELAAAFRSPGTAQARYPDLKTHTLEHYWLQDRPSKSMPNTGGVPWFFNGGEASKPATRFYDGHVALLPVKQVLRSNRVVKIQTSEELWIDEGRCFGGGGYFTAYAKNPENPTSFHVFTTVGIRGRDVLMLGAEGVDDEW